MESQKKEDVGMVRHAVGNMMGSAIARSQFAREDNKNLTQEHIQDMEEHRQEAIQRMETWLQKSGNAPDKTMLKFMDELKASSWSTEESLLAFKKNVYDPFVASEEEGLEELRDNLFKGLH